MVREGFYEAFMLNLQSFSELPEARAILLGRMGNHDEALKIYIYRLKDYSAAEASVLNCSVIHPRLTT